MSVQTESHVSQDLRMITRQGLLPAKGRGWLAGFGNMLSKELGEWFGTRRWLWQLLLWPIILGGYIAAILFLIPLIESTNPAMKGMSETIFLGLPPEQGAVSLFYGMVMLIGAIGAIILVQDEIILEKQSGTAAWILSKPVARPAFILTKLLSNIVSLLIFVIFVPSVIVVGEIYLKTHLLVPLVPFLAGLAVVLLGLAFYTSLVIMLGVVCESRSKVLGVAFGIFFAGTILKSFIPQLGYILPIAMDGIGLSIFLGMPLPNMLLSELISVAVLTIVFIVMALWRFQHKEF
jgi:ABC-2 type transport system permease protein